jgi:hypothetical protein
LNKTLLILHGAKNKQFKKKKKYIIGRCLVDGPIKSSACKTGYVSVYEGVVVSTVNSFEAK